MSAKAIYESDAKKIIFTQLKERLTSDIVTFQKFYSVEFDSCKKTFVFENNFFDQNVKLVVKSDQLIKRRGKLNLILLNSCFEQIHKWISDKINTNVCINGTNGKLKRFIVEPFLPHETVDEHYLAIVSKKDYDEILYVRQGGVDVGDVDKCCKNVQIEIDEDIKSESEKLATLFSKSDKRERDNFVEFVTHLYDIYKKLHFTYLEINPIVYKDGKFCVMDVAAKLDQTAEYICCRDWQRVVFPPPFGRDAFPEESRIQQLDAKSGASLKLTILNEYGSIWTMVAGGGASVIYTDTICDLGGTEELANYGEYSGAPSECQTYEYAKTILGLLIKHKIKKQKTLIIGGGIANFTNVAATFKGIGRALEKFRESLIEQNVRIFVRRGGPNYQQGLRYLNCLGEKLNINMKVFGPEAHMTSIVAMALNDAKIPDKPSQLSQNMTARFLLPSTDYTAEKVGSRPISLSSFVADDDENHLFTPKTKAIVWGLQAKAVQRMVDFDYVCRRDDPSVVAIIYPMTDDHFQKFYWGHKEILVPVYRKMADAVKKYKNASVLVNYASLRSAYDSTVEASTYEQFKTIIIIAEGIPENMSRKLGKIAKTKKINIIGPATVGGIKPGCFKIGNTGGMLDNILAAKLYRPGSVAYVSRSGGMSNELNNIISSNSNGVYEGIAIGGDRYPCTTFLDHITRFNNIPEIKMIVLLGEVGGTLEYQVVEKLLSKDISKPLIAWCIGTCADKLNSEVQFGHAGSMAQVEMETAIAKNEAFRRAGAIVPETFDDLDVKIAQVYQSLVSSGVIIETDEIPPPTVPMDYSWAQELGIIRKPASFISTISDERGQELLYCGMPITEIINNDMGIGGVLGLLWFQKRLPPYACRFLEMCLMLTADHGPAVSGAHNTIVCARAGKDLVSCLCSGLLTIGNKFGGALDASARQFSKAFDRGLFPSEFVNEVRKEGKLIMGIGHRVKSVNNPDQRVTILKEYVMNNFISTELLKYALDVEKVTTAKKSNLILNVDGCIAVTMVDLLRSCGCFTSEECQNYIEMGSLNSLFVLGRSIGFIGHYMDQKRLKQDLYRHPWDDITYVMPEVYDP